MKNKYIKPSMQVYDLKSTPLILTTSGGGGMGYVPGLAEDEKQLA